MRYYLAEGKGQRAKGIGHISPRLRTAIERTAEVTPTGKAIGLDVGLNHFYTDSTAATVPNPPSLRKSEKSLKQLQKQVSWKKKVQLIAKKL